MIELFYDATPNGRKIVIMLEETGLAYRIRWIDLSKGAQFDPAFQTLSPSSKIPAMVDFEGDEGAPVVLFESGAILLYLADKTGCLLPPAGVQRIEVLKWLFWQTSTFGPTLGQATHFHSYLPRRGERNIYGRDRYVGAANHLYGVLNERLADRDYVAGRFSIADIAVYPWVRVAKGHGVDIDRYPNVAVWSGRIAERPSAAVKPEKNPGTAAFQSYQSERDDVWATLFVPAHHDQAKKGTEK